jgi:hypothetical protein
MNSWLYPISSRSGHHFEDRQGRAIPVSYEAFRDYVVPGIIKDEDWHVHSNFSLIQPDDEIFIYTGDGDQGIIGYARVIGKDARNHSISFHLDQTKTSQLLLKRVPAPLVRPLMPPPRAALVNLKEGIVQIRKLLPWHSTRRAKNSAALSKLNLKPITHIFANMPGGKRKKWLRHDSVLSGVNVHLAAHGFEVGARSINRLRVDMVGVRGSKTVIVEAKMIGAGGGRLEARSGLGQLLEYSWLLGRAQAGPAHILWLAFSAVPDAAVRNFLTNQNVLVSWPTRSRITVAGGERLVS